MADDNEKLFPLSLTQNPAPVKEAGQEFERAVRNQTERILSDFLRLLPDNYVSQTSGPHYILQYQAAAEYIAKIQISAQESFEDSDFQFTRSEFLFQILGALVFPQGATKGIPQIEGDITYRSFLRQMALLLLEGARPDVVQSGIELLTDSDITIIEKVIAGREEGSAWGFDDQFSFEVNVSTEGGTEFPAEDPFTLEENVRLVIEALKPAHALYEYRNLFLDTFHPDQGEVIEDDVEWELESFHYDDFRKYCLGARCIRSTAGETLTDRTLFTDTSRNFWTILPDAVLRIESGANEGSYLVEEVLVFPLGVDSTPRAYTTAPTGLSGQITVIDSETLEDISQDFSAAVEGEVLTISEGPNLGSYHLKLLLGPGGGPIGYSPGPATQVRPAPCLLRLRTRMPVAITGQTYCLEVDRLGIREPKTVVGEDASSFFFL